MSKSRHIHECMFNQELAILQKLDHQNIIRFKEAGADERDFYIVTHYNTGGELFDRIVGDEYDMTESAVAKIVKDMLQALRHLHEKNIVHRDLKPENWLFDSPSHDANIILIDFGTALVVEEDAQYTDLVGTPFYLAPESATNAPFRTGAMLKASDIWAIGVIAYICMTGSPPFYGQSNREICRAIVKQKLQFPEGSDLSTSFKDFVGRALQKRWKKRLNVNEARQHPWVIGQTAKDNDISIDTIRSLRQFTAQTKLKKAVSRILAQNMGDKPQQRVKEHFTRLDEDGNGCLDVDELTQVFVHLNYHPTEARAEAVKVLEEVDTDNNGEINFEEFATVWQRKLLSVNDQYIHVVFSVLDINHDGYIDKDELAEVMDWMSPDEIDEMIGEADQGNTDGRIDFAEFRNAMKETVQPDTLQNKTLDADDLENDHDLHEE